MIYNLGSINADYTYRVTHLPAPGETLAALGMARGLGGKGANQSVAAARAGSPVVHIGTVGADGDWAIDTLRGHGVDVTFVGQGPTPTGHAMISVDEAGENAIILYTGANMEQSLQSLESALSKGKHGDILLLQNETNLQVDAARIARQRQMTVIYSAAPFDCSALDLVIPFVDILVMNMGEAATLSLRPDCQMIITHGARGAEWIAGSESIHVPAFPVRAVDTTGAGDCFIGYVSAGLDQGLSMQKSLELGAAAAALQIQRPGTAEAIPDRSEVAHLFS